MQVGGGEGTRDVDALFDATYGLLRRVAGKCFQNERNGVTLQPTAVVHEAYIRLADQPAFAFRNRLTFLAYAARVMRQVLVDEARRRSAAKRGGEARPITLADDMLAERSARPEVLDLNEALTRLERIDARKALVVQMRFFSGMRIAEVADVLELSVATINREWRAARAWLGRELAA